MSTSGQNPDSGGGDGPGSRSGRIPGLKSGSAWGPGAGPGYRRPVPPAPIEAVEVCHPALPEALDGLTVLHLTDLHVRRPAAPGPRFDRLGEALARTPADLVVLTGDYAHHPGDEEAACRALERLAGVWRARLGAFGVFGNHDSPEMARLARERVGSVRWLENEVVEVPGVPGGLLRVLGASYPEDLLGAMLRSGGGSEGETGGETRPGGPSHGGEAFTIVLAHYPTEVYPAAELNLPLVLAGHTHGGQFRLSPRHAPHTSSDFPRHLAAGLLRLRGTLCAVSRGLGEAVVTLRINCPPQVPLYTLRRGPLPSGRARGAGKGERSELRQVVAW